MKCLTLLGAFLLVLITAGFLACWYVTGRLVTKQNPVTCRLLADEIMLFTHWQGLQGLASYGGIDAEEVNKEEKSSKISFAR